ncbi:MAG: phosphomannomutase/phosphoglucomutase [Candidatus Liptonbacteria bacterium]|nr:phosphomannomutase/phosphoglucomutase [Candidatus Liptonbacteria bacterium]
MNINPTIFREYDIRGVAGSEFDKKIVEEYEKLYGAFPGVTLTLASAEAIGKAYGTVIKRGGGKEVVIGHELRPFADELTDAFISGVRRTGCSVTDLGTALTPIVYFITAYLKFDGGVNVTGSHNIYFFNGFKLMKKDVWPLFGEELKKMQRMVDADDFIEASPGSYKKIDGYKIYKEYFLSHIKLQKKLKVVVDTGNGSAGIFAPDLLTALGCEVVGLYIEPDATFPNHVPDPEARQGLVDLQKKVVAEKADIGIALDADGDRAGFITEKGEYIDGDLALLVFARDVLKRNPGKKVLFDVKCSQLLGELIPKYGGVPLMHRTGHAPIKETLREDREIIFGGEVSGHMYFVEDYFRIDDGLWAAGKMLEILSRGSGIFSSLFADIPSRVRTPEIKLPCADEKKFFVVDRIKKDLGAKFSISDIDGARVQISRTGWGLIRASNTSPYLTIRAEGESEVEAIMVKNILADELEKFPEIGDRLNRSAVTTLTGKLGWV